MNPCRHCSQGAEWRYKDGWGVLACADWFAGACDGPPLDVAPPSLGDVRPQGGGGDEDENENNWLKTRLRALWPLDEKENISTAKHLQECPGEWVGPLEPPKGWAPWLN